MYILLDTSSPEYFTLALVKPDGTWRAHQKVVSHFAQSEKLLPHLDKLMKKFRLTTEQVSGIFVVAGPGGFTSLRIGVMTANTLGFAWKKPVFPIRADGYDARSGVRPSLVSKLNKARLNSQVRPQYGRPPHITKPKRR
ncbi:MAG: tRNA (adenosine(37)-N6)-threonylcarbamoyltransferase complex dimerization subunit type 1 TsaB [Patescibacteria group bacterium]